VVLALHPVLSISIIGIVDVESAYKHKAPQHICGTHAYFEHRQWCVIALLEESFRSMYVNRGAQHVETPELVDVRFIYTFGKELLDHRPINAQPID